VLLILNVYKLFKFHIVNLTKMDRNGLISKDKI